jgi:hypothetical protein
MTSFVNNVIRTYVFKSNNYIGLHSGVDLLEDKTEKKRGTGPTGKMKQLFEKASELPRHQQQKISAVFEAFIAQHSLESKNAFK